MSECALILLWMERHVRMMGVVLYLGRVCMCVVMVVLVLV